MTRRIGWLAVVATAALGVAGPGRADDDAASVAAQPASDATATATDPNPQRGRRVYQRYCSICHGVRGEGGAGPSLQGISTRLKVDQIEHQIVEPRGSMPRLYPTPVDKSSLGDLQAYLQLLK